MRATDCRAFRGACSYLAATSQWSVAVEVRQNKPGEATAFIQIERYGSDSASACGRIALCEVLCLPPNVKIQSFFQHVGCRRGDLMRRRNLILGLMVVAAMSPAHAQQSGKVHRIAIAHASTAHGHVLRPCGLDCPVGQTRSEDLRGIIGGYHRRWAGHHAHFYCLLCEVFH
jgi:hypothetical protein